VTYSSRPHHGPVVDSAPSKNECQECFLGVTVTGAWGWRPYHLYVPNVMEIWETKPPGTLWPTPGLLRDCFTFTFTFAVLAGSCFDEVSVFSFVLQTTSKVLCVLPLRHVDRKDNSWTLYSKPQRDGHLEGHFGTASVIILIEDIPVCFNSHNKTTSLLRQKHKQYYIIIDNYQ